MLMHQSSGGADTPRGFWNSRSAGIRRELIRLRAQAKKTALRLTLKDEWRESKAGVTGRVYRDYEEYREHQALKVEALRAKSLAGHDRRFYAALRERLVEFYGDFTGQKVLCLAARIGTEVRVFVDLGAFAVGIDLNPGPDNRYVVVGDFHDLQFADDSVDVVYTNSLDHAFDLDRIMTEVGRVLGQDGKLIVELGRGTEHGTVPGFYESTTWKSVDDMISVIGRHGFQLERRRTFGPRSNDEHLLLCKQ
jgi:SAM-dependent methyltransferase